MTKDLRQGDVLLYRVDELPQGLVPVEPEGNRLVLMAGEQTGHHHAFYKESAEKDIGVNMFRDPETGERFIQISEGGGALKHEEHSTVLVPPGVFRLPVQVEDNEEMIRQVAD